MVTFLLICVIYVLSGKAALLLALPPGYASAIFPPAGIAVALAFIMGRRVLPAIFVGSLLLNIWAGYSTAHHIDPTGLAAATLIGVASTLQAAAGGWALSRAIGYPAAMDNTRDIFRFLLLIPVICLVSATLSVAGLGLLGIFDADGLPINWFSWWAGDSLGVMVMLPVTMALIGEPRDLWRRRLRTVALPMLLILAFFVAVYLKTNHWEQEDSLKEFNQVSLQAVGGLEGHLEEQETLLIALRSHFMYDGSDIVTRQEFRSIADDLLHRFPMIQALEWVPRVEAAQRAAFEARQRRQIPGFEIRDRNREGKLQRAEDRLQYFPVTYIEPLNGNEQAMGFDLWSNSRRRETIKKSIASGKAVATAPIRLVQSDNQPGLLYLQAVKPDDHVAGVVLSVLKLHNFVNKSLPATASILQIRMIDEETKQVVYDSFTSPKQPVLFGQRFKFGGRAYLLQTSPTAAYLKAHRSWQSWGVLAMGTFGTGVLGALLLLGTGYTARVEGQVDDRMRELRETDNALKLSNARLNEAQRIAKLGSWTHDLRSDRLEWSDQIYRIFEIDPDEFGASYDAFLNAIHPEDREAVNDTYKRSVANRTPYVMTHRLLMADGRVKYVTERGESEYAEDGTPKLSRGTVQDVTMNHLAEQELRRQERETQAILDNAQVAIISATPLGIITSFNHAAEEMLGYRAEEMVGKRTPAVFHDPDEVAARAKQFGEELGIELAPGFDVFVEKTKHGLPNENEWTYVRKDGSRFPVSLSISAMRDEHGEIYGYLGAAKDITEHKRMERMKSEFVATVSHELRTPLTSISGALGLMSGGALGSLPEPIRNMVDIAYKNSLRLGHLINDLLDMEKIAAGKLDFHMQVEPLMPLVEQALEANDSFAKQYNVRFLLKERDEDVKVRVDATRLVQILSNFLSNAAKFSPDGSEVEVSVRRMDGLVRVAVTDQGPGIAEDFRPYIFQKFAQADSSDTRKKGGSGLGLSITKELAERMDGSVGFESEEGKGSIFFVDLPLSQQDGNA